MVRKTHTLPELTRLGMQALIKSLGPEEALRFVRQFRLGRGDYTEERHAWLDDLTIEDIVRDIEARRHTAGNQAGGNNDE